MKFKIILIKKKRILYVNNENNNQSYKKQDKMSIKERIINKFLNKSNSYVYYKKGYKSFKAENKDLQNKLVQFQKDNNQLIYNINDLKNQLDDSQFLISVFEKRFKMGKYNQFNKKIDDLNIAYVLSGFPIHSETFIVSEVKWLIENDFNIFVFTRFDSYKIVDIDFEVEIIRFNSMLELESLLINYDIDLMHTHFVYPVCTNFTFPVAEKLGIPFTVFAHAFDIFIKENDKLNNISEISLSDYCLGIFTLSEFHKNYLIERDVDSDKIIVTKQATDYEIIPIKEKNTDVHKIVSVSRFVEKKGLDILISAAKLLEGENFEFSIYGFGDLEKDLQNQINELECKNISIKGELAPEKVKEVLLDSDLLVSPCKIAKNGDMDGFPTIIFESMAIGLPILTTSVSAIPEIINDGVNGFITDPNDPKMFADKIIEISNLSADELLKIRKKAQEDVSVISSVNKTMETYMDIIKKKYYLK